MFPCIRNRVCNVVPRNESQCRPTQMVSARRCVHVVDGVHALFLLSAEHVLLGIVEGCRGIYRNKQVYLLYILLYIFLYVLFYTFLYIMRSTWRACVRGKTKCTNVPIGGRGQCVRMVCACVRVRLLTDQSLHGGIAPYFSEHKHTYTDAWRQHNIV